MSVRPDILGQLNREQMISLLQDFACIQCYRYDTNSTLREAIRVNLKDNTLTWEDLQTVMENKEM